MVASEVVPCPIEPSSHTVPIWEEAVESEVVPAIAVPVHIRDGDKGSIAFRNLGPRHHTVAIWQQRGNAHHLCALATVRPQPVPVLGG